MLIILLVELSLKPNKYCASVSLVRVVVVHSRENRWRRRLKVFPEIVVTIGIFFFMLIVSVAVAIIFGSRSSASSESDRLRRCCSTTSRGQEPRIMCGAGGDQGLA